MSATYELRAELTKRGVKWSNRDGFNDYKTVWHHAHTGYLFIESLFYSDTTILKVRKPTVAQAIAATLGAGTCKNVHEPPKDTTFWPVPHFKCSECGATHVSMEYVFYCPNCGRKVVDE